MYEPLHVEREWTALHKAILRSYSTDKNLFFTYFNGGLVPLAVQVDWSEEEKRILIDMLINFFECN